MERMGIRGFNIDNFRWYRDGSVNVNSFPRYRIEGQLIGIDPATGQPTVVQDRTGANRITFPNDVRNFTDVERDYLISTIAMTMLEIVTGTADIPE